MYCAWDIGGGFLGAARRRTRILFSRLLSVCPPVPFAVHGPPWVVVTAWRQHGGRVVFHLLQAQGTPSRFPEEAPYTVLEDIPPVHDVGISLTWSGSRAWLPLSGNELPVHRRKATADVTVPCVDRHEIVVFEP